MCLYKCVCDVIQIFCNFQTLNAISKKSKRNRKVIDFLAKGFQNISEISGETWETQVNI